MSNLLDKILCWFGWHTPDRSYRNAYRDGIKRPHAWCKYCHKHTPLFVRGWKKIIFGKIRVRENNIDNQGKNWKYKGVK